MVEALTKISIVVIVVIVIGIGPLFRMATLAGPLIDVLMGPLLLAGPLVVNTTLADTLTADRSEAGIEPLKTLRTGFMKGSLLGVANWSEQTALNRYKRTTCFRVG